MKKNVFVFLFNGFSDWEISYLTPEINKNKDFDLVYFSNDGDSVLSMGGLKIMPDIPLSEVHSDNVHMLILPGGNAWENGENSELDQLTEALFNKEKTIAAICAATTYLAKKGFLNNLVHTSNDLSYLKGMVPSYSGEKSYTDSLAVTDNNIITANGIAPIEFAREIFRKVELYNDNDIDKWFQLFKNGIWEE